MLKHSFTVAKDADSPSVEVSVNVKSFEEADAAMRKRMWEEAMKSVTIKVQGTLRRRMGKGIKGAALVTEAQEAFDNVLNGVRSRTVSKPAVDATEAKLTRAQIDLLVASGVEVRNIPEGV